MRSDIYERIEIMSLENKDINYAEVGRIYNVDPRTVKRYHQQGESAKERKSRKVEKKTDPYVEIIIEKMKYNAPAIAIYSCLKERYGYDGSYSLIKSFVHDAKEDFVKKATVRFETSPGLQCQIDWKEHMTLINRSNEIFLIHIFLGILGYSRMKYIELTLDKSQKTLFKCHINMFKYFGGTAKEFLYDNMKTVVDMSRTQFSEPVYNTTFIQFAKDANIIPKSCMAYRPRTKGKVETVAKIMNRLKAYNKEFDTLDELQQIINDLLYQINHIEISQTTGEIPVKRFQKEKEYLLPEPNYDILNDYTNEPRILRKVSKESLVTFNGKRYSVPNKYIGKEVELQIQDNTLQIYYSSKFVEKHYITNKKITYSKDDYDQCLSAIFPNSQDIENICNRNLELLDKL